MKRPYKSQDLSADWWPTSILNTDANALPVDIGVMYGQQEDPLVIADFLEDQFYY